MSDLIAAKGGALPDGTGSRASHEDALAASPKASIPSAAQCECDICQYGREVRRHLSMLSDDVRPFFADMHERLFHAEDDLDYARAVLDGSWPSAVPQLQRALDEAWRIARERGYDRDWPESLAQPSGGDSNA